jgi:hypothetical protein
VSIISAYVDFYFVFKFMLAVLLSSTITIYLATQLMGLGPKADYILQHDATSASTNGHKKE